MDAKCEFANLIWTKYIIRVYGVEACNTYQNSSYTSQERIEDLYLQNEED